MRGVQSDHVGRAQVAGVEHTTLAEERTLVEPAWEASTLANSNTKFALRQVE